MTERAGRNKLNPGGLSHPGTARDLIPTAYLGLPTTKPRTETIDDEYCSHALNNERNFTGIRVIAGTNWPAQTVRQHLKRG
jgi:hypothetical protein